MNFFQIPFKKAWTHHILALLAGMALLASASVLQAATPHAVQMESSGQRLLQTSRNTVYAGEVYIDANRNEIRDQNETGLSNIPVRVETMEGSPLFETASDEDGYYVFNGLPEDTLRVRVLPPRGYSVSANGEYVISTVDPQAPTILSTGLFQGVYLPIIGKNSR